VSMSWIVIYLTCKYSLLCDIVILGNFNICTRTLQVLIHDWFEDVLCVHELDPNLFDLQRDSIEISSLFMTYGRHLLWFVESYGLFILNGLFCYLDSNICTCFPHSGGASLVVILGPHLPHLELPCLPRLLNMPTLLSPSQHNTLTQVH
jgi:hypothetical protein